MEIIYINSSCVPLTLGHCPAAATGNRHKLSHMPAHGALVLLPGMVLMKFWKPSGLTCSPGARQGLLLLVQATSWGKPTVIPCHGVGTAGTPVLTGEQC